MTVLEAKGLVKKFAEKTAVDGVSLQIQKGECFGILGPNGAGKSTLMKMLYGLCTIDDGELYILGINASKNMRAVKEKIGVVPQEDCLEQDFTVIENLTLFSRYFGVEKRVSKYRAEDLLRLMRLEDYKNNFIFTLSGGMKKRLAISRGLINHPDILFLDEPTSGLDPQSRVWVWDFLKKIKAELGTVVMTTHYMEEAEKICDRIAIMDHGKILALGKPSDIILSEIGEEIVEFEISKEDMFYYVSRLKEKSLNYQIFENTLIVYVKANENGRSIVSIVPSGKVTIRKPQLNDVFFKLAGYQLRDEPL